MLSHLKILFLKKCDHETGPLREETDEELAMVVSPNQTPVTARTASVPSIEVQSPWSQTNVWSSTVDTSDHTPLLNISSSPSSDTDTDCHVSNITVVTDTTEADNITSISIEHDNSAFHSNQEQDNKVKHKGPLSSNPNSKF